MKVKKHKKNKPGAGRPKLYRVRILLPLAGGMLAAIDARLEDGETRLDLIRAAIETELAKRGRGLEQNNTTIDQAVARLKSF